MVSIALKISDEARSNIDKLPWVNWSELAREEIVKDLLKEEAFNELEKLTRDSKLTDKDCLKLGRMLKKSVLGRLKKEKVP